MNWLDTIIGWISPEAGARREAWRQVLAEQRHYDAGDHRRLNNGWYATNQSAEYTDRYSRDVVRARSRDLERISSIRPLPVVSVSPLVPPVNVPFSPSFQPDAASPVIPFSPVPVSAAADEVALLFEVSFILPLFLPAQAVRERDKNTSIHANNNGLIFFIKHSPFIVMYS